MSVAKFYPTNAFFSDVCFRDFFDPGCDTKFCVKYSQKHVINVGLMLVAKFNPRNQNKTSYIPIKYKLH